MPTAQDSCNGDLPNGYAVTNGTQKSSKSLVDIIGAGKRCIWNKKVKGTEMEKFKNFVAAKYNIKFESYWDLHKWSIENHETFWEEIWKYFDIIFSKTYDKVLQNSKYFIDAEWFIGARLNYAENMLRYRDDHVALIYVDEEGNEEIVTYAQLYEKVTLYAAAFKKHGLKKGDTVACFMSNRNEAVYAMLAAASIGALFGGPLPFYGPRAASNIIQLMNPKFLITVDRFLDAGNEISIKKNLPEILKGIDSLEKVIVVPTIPETVSEGLSGVKNSCFLKEFLDSGRRPDGSVEELEFEQLPFNHPLFVSFTSGTTGLPKGLIHSFGILLANMKDFLLTFNTRRGDVILNTLPVGWNVWNSYLSNLALGATVLHYNGTPYFLSKTYFYDLLEKYKVSYVLIVTCIADRLEKNDIAPGPGCVLDHLRVVSLGASPVKLQNCEYFLRVGSKNTFVTCNYGATEIAGIFNGCDMNEPVYSGEQQAPALGVDLRCIDENGVDLVGKRGEIAVGKPFPSMPVGVLRDKQKIYDTYFSKFPGMYTQNDEGWVDPETKGFVVIGRSDETLNANGERFGSSDIYYAIHNMEELADYLCVGQYNSYGDQRVVLFIKLVAGYTFSPKLVSKIKEKIEYELTEDFVPEVILEAKEIPYTLNNKRMERLVKNIISTNSVPNVSNVKNPNCLRNFCNIPELQNY